jgi:hypothetical protein
MCGVGQCARTAAACVNGDAGTCTPGMPVAETCNNLDDDCNNVVDGITRGCYTGPAGTSGVGTCRNGTQTCTAGSWQSTCPGEVTPIAEVCGNSLDDNCNGTPDDGCSGCTVNGLYTLDAGSINYTCCLGSVNIAVTQFQLLGSGATIIPGPTHSGGNLNGVATTCPSGTITGTKVLTGGCTETYTLNATFVGPNTWVGTYKAQFTGSQCGCFGLDPCVTQTWNISAGR